MLRLLNAMLKTGMLPEQNYKIGFGFVDMVARAVRLLSEPENLSGRTFHIDNPNTQPLSELFRLAGISAQVLPRDELVKRLSGMKTPAAGEYLGRLAQGSLEKAGADVVQGEIVMEATLVLLERLGFKWPCVTEEYMKRIVRNLGQGGR